MTSQVESISYFIQLQSCISNAIMVKFRGLALHHKKMKITFICTIYNIRVRVVSDIQTPAEQNSVYHSIQTLIKNVFLLNFAHELLMSLLILYPVEPRCYDQHSTKKFSSN